MAALVLDIAWERPSIAQIKATGAVGVIRYFSTDDTKDLHASEVPAYAAAGLGIGTVYETTSGRATAGRAAGVADAKDAERQRKAAGLPASHVHYFAVDADVSWGAVAAYFAGVLSVLPAHRVGCYGGFRVVQGAHKAGVGLCWQTLAWSYGQLSPAANLYQSGGTLLGGAADINKVLSPVGDWGQTPRPPEADMPLSDVDIAKQAAANTRNLLGTAIPALPDDTNETRSLAAVIGRLEHELAETLTLVTAQGNAIAALQTTGLTPNQVTALAAALGPDLADIIAKRLAS